MNESVGLAARTAPEEAALVPRPHPREMPVQSLRRAGRRNGDARSPGPGDGAGREAIRVPYSSNACHPAIRRERERFERSISIRRWTYFILVAATTLIALARLWSVVRIDSLLPLEIALLGVFGVLFAWISSSFWLACFGTFARLSGASLDCLSRSSQPRPEADPDACRTAIVMPIYNEDVDRLYAGLTSICESLREAGGAGRFDVYVLSDSNDEAVAASEREGASRLREAMGDSFGVYYRRRTSNEGRKSGNISEFCRNWGSLYEYMVVVDADSLMSGQTLIELVGLMDANPGTALIQVPPMIVGRESLFGRIQQFASSVYGPVFATGLAYLQGGDGNFWGHNAIIRVQAFMDSCGLPVLAGRPPLGGEIISHDFVEAALLRRAGWDLWLLPDLGGSFEETPPTAIDHLARDRRWCQGNMQHVRLLCAHGLKTASRLHLAVGIMSYLSSPLWLAMIVLSVIEAHMLAGAQAVSYIGHQPVLTWPISHLATFVILISAMAVMLVGPKLMAYLLLLRDRERMAAHGGAVRVALSVFWENVFSVLFAPVAMLSHSLFVFSIMLGRNTRWGGQQRDDHTLPLVGFTRRFSPHAVFGILAAAGTYALVSQSIWWLSPMLAGLILAIPLTYLTSKVEAGKMARQCGLFLVPSETTGIPVVRRQSLLLRFGIDRLVPPAMGVSP